MCMKDAQPIRWKRTDEERRRRHLFGEGGAKFSARLMHVGTGGVMSTITTVYDKDNIIAELMEKELQNKRYRIRKLTPRECFRLMDVDDSNIDKIQTSGVSESQQYKMAGNSIVVACMEGIFRNLFTNEEREQLTLF